MTNSAARRVVRQPCDQEDNFSSNMSNVVLANNIESRPKSSNISFEIESDKEKNQIEEEEK